jgi:hypothetical protein
MPIGKTCIVFVLWSLAAIAMAQYDCGHEAQPMPKELYGQVREIHDSFEPDALAEIEDSALPFISTTFYECLDHAFDTYDDLNLRAGSITACRLRHPGGLSCGDSMSWVNGPRDKVGPSLADWITLFSDDYTIEQLGSSRNVHTGQPLVTFWITDGSTTAHFMVNLVTNDQFLIEVESVSPRFLKMLRIDLIPVDENGNALLEDSWDAGTNRLRVRRIGDQEFGAVWNYYWD